MAGGFILRCLLTVGLVCALGDSRCTSPQIRKEVIEQQHENSEATAIVRQYIPAGPQQEKVVKALTDSSALLEVTAVAYETQKERADEAEADASKWHWIKWLGIAALTAAAGWGGLQIWRKVLPG